MFTTLFAVCFVLLFIILFFDAADERCCFTRFAERDADEKSAMLRHDAAMSLYER